MGSRPVRSIRRSTTRFRSTSARVRALVSMRRGHLARNFKRSPTSRAGKSTTFRNFAPDTRKESLMPNPSRRAFLARAAAASAAAAAAGVPVLRPAFAQDALAVNIACIPSDIAGSAYYASDNGFFKKSGVNASFLGITNGAAITAAVLGGSADIGYSNVISLLLAHSRGLPITILFPANLHSHEAPTAGLMSVNKSSPITSARDFNGKTI